MTLDIQQLHPMFFGEIRGVDLNGDLGDTTIRSIADAIDRYAVVVFRQPVHVASRSTV